MSSNSNSKKSGRNLKALFSVICVSIIALGIIVYATNKPQNTDVNEPTTIVDTTAVQKSVTVKESTTQATTAQTTEKAETTTKQTTMPQGESNTPYKSVYEYPLTEEILSGYTEELVFSQTMNDYRSHTAVDFKGAAGADVRSINDGLVLDVYSDSMLGMVVEIDHGGKLVARYCGLDSISVKAGDNVEIGESIGTLGKVPFESSAEAHLHFETELDGKYVSPLTVMGKVE